MKTKKQENEKQNTKKQENKLNHFFIRVNLTHSYEHSIDSTHYNK